MNSSPIHNMPSPRLWCRWILEVVLFCTDMECKGYVANFMTTHLPPIHFIKFVTEHVIEFPLRVPPPNS